MICYRLYNLKVFCFFLNFVVFNYFIINIMLVNVFLDIGEVVFILLLSLNFGLFIRWQWILSFDCKYGIKKLVFMYEGNKIG